MLRRSVGKPAAEWRAPEVPAVGYLSSMSCNGGAPMLHELKRDCRVRIFPKPSERLRCRSWFCHGCFEVRTAAGFGIRTPIGGGGRRRCQRPDPFPPPASPLPHYPQPRHITTQSERTSQWPVLSNDIQVSTYALVVSGWCDRVMCRWAAAWGGPTLGPEGNQKTRSRIVLQQDIGTFPARLTAAPCDRSGPGNANSGRTRPTPCAPRPANSYRAN